MHVLRILLVKRIIVRTEGLKMANKFETKTSI